MGPRQTRGVIFVQPVAADRRSTFLHSARLSGRSSPSLSSRGRAIQRAPRERPPGRICTMRADRPDTRIRDEHPGKTQILTRTRIALNIHTPPERQFGLPQTG
jgi:hypothetical protein